jgi:Domain of unknown function (DUF4382)
VKSLVRLKAAIALLGPLSIIAALAAGPIGCGSGGSDGGATPTPTMGFVEIGFVDSPSSDFQQILLNVVSVRVNPSNNPMVSFIDSRWVTIPAPEAFGASAELQIDLNSVQDNVQIFGIHRIPTQTYHQVEVILDANHPGMVVPNCPKAGATNEGCLTYPFQLPKTATGLRFSTSLHVTKRGLSPLGIDFSPGTITAPPSFGGSYTLAPVLSAASFTALMGTVAGSVSGAGGGTEVAAEQSGTGSVIARTRLESDGSFTLELPAASSTASTSYDLFVSGDNVTYAAVSGLPVTRGGSASPDFSVGSASIGRIGGKIVDAATSAPIQGATLSLLVKPQNNPGADCKTTPSDCVIVATANTDDNGHYPLPGTVFAPPRFAQVPFGTYTLEVNAAGYDTVLATAPVTALGTSAICGAPNTSNTNCSFSLTSNIIKGTVSLDQPAAAGSEVQVLVAAETSGTNQLQNVTAATVPGNKDQADFAINVPTSITNFDLFATAQDFFNGVPSPFPGHTIEVHGGISVTGGPGAEVDCDGAQPCLGPLTCAGHASLSGMVGGTFDSGTTVRLSKDNVQLMESTVGPASTNNAGQFSFCAPPDIYTLTRYQNGSSDPSSTPTTVMLATPEPTSSPCPGICSLPDGECPSICNNTPLQNPL